MAVPRFDEFLYPFLLQLKDKKVTTNEMRQLLTNHFGLTEEDLAIKTRNNTSTQFSDRFGWARQYLRRAGMLTIPKKGEYKITARGAEFLKNHKKLEVADLMEYPEFLTFANGTGNGKSAQVSKGPTMMETVDITPDEQLEGAYKQINDKLADELLAKVKEQSPQFFEHLVLDLLLKMGYGDPTDESATVTPYSHDDGIDGIIPQDKLGLDMIYFQAKRYTPGNVIGKPMLQSFVGALDEKNAMKGVFITTSSYTNEALKYINKTSKKIVLIDGEKLARYMIEYNVGVSTTKTYEVKRIDSDYFYEEQQEI